MIFKLMVLLSFSLNMCAAFFYCEVDGSSLCLPCDMSVHVGGKRSHGRYLLLRQRVEVCHQRESSHALLFCIISVQKNVVFILNFVIFGVTHFN